jgi:hypothetical protein
MRTTASLICIILALFGVIGTVSSDRQRPNDAIDWIISVSGELFIPAVLLIVGLFLLLSRPSRRTNLTNGQSGLR